MSNITWKRNNEQYTNGVIGNLGKIAIGNVNWDCSASDKELRYKVTCTLPQAKRTDTNFATEEEGKQRLQMIVKQWLVDAGL